MDDLIIKEIRDRMVRVETRFTRYLNDRGFDTGTDKPAMVSNTMMSVPSPNVRLGDVLDAIPLSLCNTEIAVFLGKDHICDVIRSVDYDRG